MQKLFVLFLGLCLLNFIGCAPTAYVKTGAPAGVPGIYHRVEKGQTLWRIAKIYNVDLEELARINRISDTTSIEIGQMLFIPNRQKHQAVPTRYSADDFIWPIKGRVISAFGQAYSSMINKGLNIQPYGNSDVIASRAGKAVFYNDNFGAFGKTLIIDHGDGFSTVYARNQEIHIRVGDNVQQGTLIARAGTAGRDRNRYLHFEIRKSGVPQNPYYYLP